MTDYLHKYLLINSLVQEVGFERALLIICMNIVLCAKNSGFSEKQNNIKVWFHYIICNKKVRAIKKYISSGRIGGNCVAIALFSFFELGVRGCDPEVVNEVCLVDGKVEAHMCVKCRKKVVNRNIRPKASAIRIIRLENVISEWIEGVCHQHVVDHK